MEHIVASLICSVCVFANIYLIFSQKSYLNLWSVLNFFLFLLHTALICNCYMVNTCRSNVQGNRFLLISINQLISLIRRAVGA